MTDAILTFTVDSSGAGSVDLDRIEVSAGKAEAAAQKFSTSTKRAFKETSDAADTMATRIMNSVSVIESVSERINRAMNIRTNFGGESRGEDIAAYGRSLDALRAKFDPLFAAQQKYTAKMAEIADANRVGAISASLMIDANIRETNSYNSLISTLNNVDLARKRAAQSMVDSKTVDPSQGRAGDIAAFGTELDRLRGKYNPLFAVTRQYLGVQQEIKEAHRTGAISLNEMNEALSVNRQRALASIDAIKGRNDALNGQRPGGGRYETANIAAQFQDIGVTAAMGMSPMMIALQQGTQLSAVFSTMEKPIQGIGAALRSVLSPLSLLTIAAVAAGAALIQYFMTASSGAASVDDILKRHKQNIEALGPAYEAVINEQKKYAEQSPTLVAARMDDNALDAQKRVLEDAQAALAKIQKEMFMEQMGNSGGMSSLTSRFDGAKSAINSFIESVNAGTPRISEFQEEITRLQNAKEISPEIAKELRSITNEAFETQKALTGIGYDKVASSFNDLSKAIDQVNPSNATGRIAELDQKLDVLYRNTKAGRITLVDLNSSLDALSGANPDLSGAIARIRELFLAAMQANGAIEILNGKQFNNAGVIGKGSRDPNVDKRKDAQEMLDFYLRTNDELVKGLDAQSKQLESAAKKRDKAGQVDRNAYRDLIKSADDRIAQMVLEEQIIGKTGVAAEAYRFELDLIQRATDKGREPTAAQIAQLKEKAEAYKVVAERVATATLAEELAFERQQMFRTDAGQRVYATLREAGIDPTSENGKFIESQIRLNEQLALTQELSQSFASTFAEGIKNGESVLDSFMNALTKVAEKLAEMFLTAGVDNLIGGGGGGGLGGLISGLFGGGGGTDAWAGMRSVTPGFATGTSSTPAGEILVGERGPERLRVPAGSAITPTHRLNVPNATDKRGAAAPQAMPMIIQVDATGARSSSELEEAIANGVSTGIRTFSEQGLPYRIQEINQDPRRIG